MRANSGIYVLALAAVVMGAGPSMAAAKAIRSIGSVAAANEAVIGTPPEQDPRKLKLGLKLFEAERVETSEIGAGQFLFLDQTSLTVWPSSDIVLDKYIYDPDKDTGEMALSATRGVLRFIGGRISKKTDVTVKTPHAVIAIRGGMAQVLVTDARTKVTNISGEYVRLYSSAGTLTLSRPMAQAEATSADAPPQFLGIGGRDEAAELYNQPLGFGDGGVQNPVTEQEVNDINVRSGVTDLGFNDPSVINQQPVSTQGERQVTDGAEVNELVVDEVEKTVIDALGDDVINEIDPPIVVDDPDPPIVIDDPDPPIVIDDPDPPVVDDPEPELSLGPVAGLTGAIIENEDVDQASILLEEGQNRPRLTDGVRREGSGDFAVIDATGAPGVAASFLEIEGFLLFAGAGRLDGRTADVVSFVEPDVFYLNAFRTIAGAPDSLALSFFGTPTPRDVWTVEAAGDAPLRSYALSVDLFSLDGGPLPERFGDPFAPTSFGDMLLIGDPDGPLVPEFDGALGPDVDTSSKWVIAFLSIQGEGADQQSAFGAMTALALPTETGQPSLSGEFLFLSRLDAAEAPAFGALPIGTIDDGAGATAFGEDGDFLVLGNGGAYALDDDPDFDAAAATFSEWSNTAETEESFGKTRVAALDEIGASIDAARIGVARPLVGSVFEGSATVPLDGVLTGGFASAAGQSFTPSAAAGDRLSAPYLLSTQSPDGVRMGFDKGTNTVVAEFAGMEPSADTPTLATDVNLNWGDARGQSAFADEDLFLAMDSTGPIGGLTGQAQSLGGSGGASSTVDDDKVRQNAFRGALAVSEAVGDGGVFPAGVDTTPEFLRWGWWAGEFRQNPDDADPDLAGRSDRLFPGVWVAGVVSDLASVRAATGEASFEGLAVGQVIATSASGTSTFVDGGSFTMQYDFGDDTGMVSIDGIAGESLTSAVSEARASGGHHFAGDLAGFRQTGSGDVRGAFFTGAGDATAATAGNFGFTATADGVQNVVSGVFAADKR